MALDGARSACVLGYLLGVLGDLLRVKMSLILGMLVLLVSDLGYDDVGEMR